MYLLHALNCTERYSTANLFLIVTEAALWHDRLDSLPLCFSPHKTLLTFIKCRLRCPMQRECIRFFFFKVTDDLWDSGFRRLFETW